MSDPFLTAQSDVLTTLDSTRSLFQSYLRIRTHSTSPSSPELLQALSELESTLTDLTTDLEDLIDSVKAVEADPYRFGLDVVEAERRRRLVEDVGREVEGMRNELRSTVHRADMATRKASGGGLPNPADFEEEDGGDYEAWEQQRQVEMMAEQDEQLDGVFQTVGNLRQQADDMGRELEEQAGILEEVDTITDRVGGKLAGGLKKVGWVIRKNEGEYWLSV
jgi:t-SNARE syntaxin family protein